MKKLIKGFVTYGKYKWQKESEAEISFTKYDPRQHPHGSEHRIEAVICEHEFEIEVPDDFDPRPQQVAQLEAAKQKVRAEFAARITEIERQISELTCLEAS